MKVRGLALFLNGCSRFRLEREQRVFSKWSRGSFEQRKARQLKRVETRIAHLQEQRTCISAATNEDAIQACRERFQPAKRRRQF